MTTLEFKSKISEDTQTINVNNGITTFIGGNGSGKSSIVFETIAKEAQRQLNETFSAFIRNFLPKYGEVKADYIENLSTPIIIDQSRIGATN